MFDYLPIPCLSTDSTFQIIGSNAVAKQVFGRYIESDEFSGSFKTITRLIVSGLSDFFTWVGSADSYREPLILEIQCANNTQNFTISHSQHEVDGRLSFLFAFSPITHNIDTSFEVDLYRSAFERSNQSIYLSDSDNKILSINPSFTHFFGLSLSEVKGKNDGFLYYDQSKSIHLEALNKLIYEVDQVEDRMSCISAFEGKSPIICSVNIVMIDDGEGTHKFLHFIEDITQQVSAEDNMKEVAFKDPLTGLSNRYSFNMKFKALFLEAQRLGEQLTLFFIDLDKFKFINDEYGHEYGDLLLIHVAERLKKSCKGYDFIARLGGDEFVILIQNDKSKVSLELIAKRILFELSKPFLLKDVNYHCTCSIGIAQYPDDAMSKKDLLHAADSAMYMAKHSGRNDFSFYNHEVQKITNLHDQRIKEIEDAVVNDSIQLYFQPIHDMVTGEVLAFEALSRYLDDQGECHLPSYFLPYIEEDPLIYKLGVNQIREIKRYLKILKHHGVQLPISMNLSSYQIKSDLIINQLEMVAKTSPDIIRLLKIEVTETMLFENNNIAIKNLNRLTVLGYSLLLDDFGTGHSSIYSLKKIDFEAVKIDKVFVNEINSTNEKEGSFLNAIIAMMKNLNIKIICEGVENQQQKDYLLQRGCKVGQGFYYSEALPRNKILKYLGV